MYYSKYDINKDGIKELLIVFRNYKEPKGVRFGGSDYAIYTYYDDKVKLADSIFCGGGSGETCMVYSGEKYILRLSHGGYDLNCYTKYILFKDGSLKVIGTCSVNGTDYMIDNKTISKLEYEKEIESYIGKQAVKMEFYK